MKKLLVLAALGGALAAAAPAQAGSFSLSISNGQGGGIVFANGKATHYNNQTSGWHRTAAYQRPGNQNNHGVRKGFTYIPGTVKAIEQRNGSKVTDIVFRDGVYHVQGFGPKGRFNTAKADPYTGKLYNVRAARPTDRTPRNVKGIRNILTGLRAHGFSKFDRVDLKGQVYQVRGLNKNGKAKLITVNSRNGHIQNVTNAKRYNLAQKAAPQRRAFKQFTGGLKKGKYSNFKNATYVASNNDWSDHYRVQARHNKRPVDLRVCAYTGKVLGYRYL